MSNSGRDSEPDLSDDLIGAWNPVESATVWDFGATPESASVAEVSSPAHFEESEGHTWHLKSEFEDFQIGPDLGGELGDDQNTAMAVVSGRRGKPAYPKLGAVLAGFILKAELGRGAFGRVYLAEQAALAGRPVALKISKALGDEPQSLARLQHAHIVPIHSIHDDPSTGFRLMCMPYLGGANLARVLETTESNHSSLESGRSLVEALDLIAPRLPDRGGDSHSPPSQVPCPPSLLSPIAAKSLWGRLKLGSRRRKSGLKGSSRFGHGGADSNPTEPKDVAEADGPARKFLRDHNFVQASAWIVARLAEGLEHAHSRGILHRDLKPSNVLIAADGTPMLLDFNLSALVDGEGAARAMLGGTLPYMAPEHLDAFNPVGDAVPLDVDHRSDLYALGLILFEMVAGRHPYRGPDPGLPLVESLGSMIEERRRGTPSARRLNPKVPPSLDSAIRKCLEPDPTRRYARAGELAEDLRRFLADLPMRHAPEPHLGERVAKWFRRHPETRSVSTIAMVAGLLIVAVGALAWAVSDRLLTAQATLRFEQFREVLRESQVLLNSRDDPDRLARGRSLALGEIDHYGADDPASWTDRPDVWKLPKDDRRVLAEGVSELILLETRASVSVANVEREGVRRAALERAVDWLDRAESIDPTPPAALFDDRARYLRALGLAERARADAARARTIGLRSARDYALLGTSMAADGRYDRAEMLLNRATALDPGRFWAWFARGLCRLEAGRYAEASGDFAVCTILAPDFAWPHLNHGLSLALSGRLDAADAAYDRALELDPKFVEARVDRASAALQRGRPDEALVDLDEAIRLGRADSSVLAARAEALARLGRRLESDRGFARAIEAAPADPRPLTARGFARLDTQPEAAALDFEAALKLDRRNARALLGLAHLARHTDAPESRRLLDRALKIDPSLDDARQLRALLLAHEGDPAALADIDALALSPTAHNLYNAACATAILARETNEPRLLPRALSLLRRALDHGFPADDAANDPDLALVRALPEFPILDPVD